MKLVTALSALGIAVLLLPAARADLMAVDWKTPGDRLLVQDDAAGLQWLRVSHTLGLSFDAVTTRLAGDLAGFSFATVAQVDDFFANARAAAPDGIRQLVDLWGPGRNWPAGFVGVSAITGTPHAQWPDSLWVAEAAYPSDPEARPELSSFAEAASGSIVHDFGHRYVGAALVRPSPVPEPTAWLLLLPGLGAAAWRAWRHPRTARCVAAASIAVTSA